LGEVSTPPRGTQSAQRRAPAKREIYFSKKIKKNNFARIESRLLTFEKMRRYLPAARGLKSINIKSIKYSNC
jgi:hypothetical protein